MSANARGRQNVEAACDLIRRHGASVRVERNGNLSHMTLYIDANGRKAIVVMSGSPSDVNTLNAALGDVRRALRSVGIDTSALKSSAPLGGAAAASSPGRPRCQRASSRIDAATANTGGAIAGMENPSVRVAWSSGTLKTLL